jgi:archaellum component FlaF (FlaF/FlaG flagellin family)
MPARLVTLLVLIAAAWAPSAHAASPAVVRMLSCTHWQEGADGSVMYVARMHSIEDSVRMSLRIRLLEKLGDGDFERVSAEGLGVWRKARAGASKFRWEQEIGGLRQGAVYRAVVRYRWHDADGNLIRAERRRSSLCDQDGALPNLRVDSIKTRAGEVEKTAVYKVKIVNDGLSEARNVGVLLRVDGEVVDEAETIDVLEPNESRTVTFNGPECHQRLRVVVDPKQLISESRERDNVLSPSCL